MESSIKLTISLCLFIVLLASLLYLTEDMHSYLLTNRDGEQLVIQTEDLKECCNYIDEEGLEKTCRIFNEFSCDNCQLLCSE